MLYVFICEDKPNSLAQRKAHRPEHLARLQALRDEGRLIIAGPNPAIDNKDPGEAGFTGSIVIAEFIDLAAAQAWAAAEPFIKHGVYERVTVKPFNQVLP